MAALFGAQAIVSPAPDDRAHREERWRVEAELKAAPEPRFDTLANEELVQAALSSPQSLWKFVTAPDTAWADRMTAAERGSLPLSYLARFVKTQLELEAERSQHNWGMHRFVSRWSSEGWSPRYEFKGPRNRKILGIEWTMAAGHLDEPLTYDEKKVAPWPWQVQQALAALRSKFFAAPPREFWNAALTLSCDTPTERADFYSLTEEYVLRARVVDPRVLGAWRNIGLAQDDLTLRGRLSTSFNPIARCWRGDEYRYAEVLMASFAEAWDEYSMVQLTFHLRDLFESYGESKTIARGRPHVAIFALARRIDALGTASVYTRGYGARWFLKAIGEHTGESESAPDANSELELERSWTAFRTWYGQHFDELRSAAAEHEKVLAPYRARLTAVSYCD